MTKQKERVLGAVLALGLGLALAAQAKPSVKKEAFGQLADGQKVDIYTLTNRHGLEARIMTYGGIVVSLKVPDRQGKLGDVVLGYDKLDDYVKNNPYFGALIGRYGNRIGKGKFTLNGKKYQLSQNDKGQHLHGGVKGFDKVVWTAVPITATGADAGLVLGYVSPEGEMGYPGMMIASVIYTLTDDDALRIRYYAFSDKDTIVNLTHHSYFNLAGEGTILGHELTIRADRFTPVDKVLIPTGELRNVEGTPFDFRKATAIGARIGQKDQQLEFGLGYDHNWALDRQGPGMETVATLHDPKSGRSMEISTVEPGLQFYSGNFLDGTNIGKGGQAYQYRTGLCLETQHYPDSPNHPNFPSTTLKAGQMYTSTTLYRFIVNK